MFRYILVFDSFFQFNLRQADRFALVVLVGRQARNLWA